MIPFPAFSFSIEEIYVNDSSNRKVDVIYSTSSGDSSGIETHFRPASWGNTITLRLRAKNDVIGISNLDVSLIDYLDADVEVGYEVPTLETASFTSISRILLDMQSPGADPQYKPLKEVEASLIVGASYATGAETRIEYATLHPTNPAQTLVTKNAGDKLYLKLKFRQNLGQTPVFKSALITHA
jgi:hypothetical protein